MGPSRRGGTRGEMRPIAMRFGCDRPRCGTHCIATDGPVGETGWMWSEYAFRGWKTSEEKYRAIIQKKALKKEKKK